MKFLHELLLMERYFDREHAVMFESDLIETHGRETIWSAIDNGLLEHRRLPFSDGRERCICWLTPEGRKKADQSAQ